MSSVLDYIPREKLTAEGFIHVSDTDAVMTAAFGTVPEMIDRRMDIPDIARWLQVSLPRLRRYITDRHQAGLLILDKDGCLSIRQILQIDWSSLTEQKRTVRISRSHFQGRKQKLKTY